MPRAVTAATVALAAAAALGLLLATTTGRAADQAVTVGPGVSFVPSSVTINVGDTVTFTWAGTLPHKIVWTAGPPTPDSDTYVGSGTFLFTPTEPGTYSYFCQVHGAGMSGSVTVNAQQQQPTATNTSPAPTATNTTAPATAAPTNTATTAAPTNTSVPTNTTAPAATATPPPATTAAGADPTDTPTPAGEDNTATPTPAGSSTDTPTPASESTAAPTPEVPDTAEDGDSDGPPWGLIIILAVIAVAVVGGGAAVLGLRGRA